MPAGRRNGEQHRTVLDGEAQEGALDLVRSTSWISSVGRDGRADRGQGEAAGGPATSSPHARQQAVDPGVEPPGSRRSDVPPGSDERLLTASSAAYPSRRMRRAIAQAVCGSREGVERLVIALLCAFDEIGDHAPSSVVARQHAALTKVCSAA
jgi:hypothetical protein